MSKKIIITTICLTLFGGLIGILLKPTSVNAADITQTPIQRREHNQDCPKDCPHFARETSSETAVQFDCVKNPDECPRRYEGNCANETMHQNSQHRGQKHQNRKHH